MEWNEETALAVARSAARRISPVEEGELLRIGLTAVVRFGSVAIKVVKPGHRSLDDLEIEQHTVALAHAHGLPVPEPLAEPDIVSGHPVAYSRYLLPDHDRMIDWGQLGGAVRALHSLKPKWLHRWEPELRLDSLDERNAQLQQSGKISSLEGLYIAELLSEISSPLEALSKEEGVWTHGDLHTGNLLVSVGQLYLLDWERSCLAPPIVDLAGITRRVSHYGLPIEDYRKFNAAYGSNHTDDPALAALNSLSFVGGITYLLSSAGELQQREGRRRLEDLMSGAAPHWQDC